MANSYTIGQQINCTVVFTDVATGAYVDPTNIRFWERDPSGNVTNHVYLVDMNVVRDSLGHYHYNLLLDEAGTWYYGWIGTGSHAASGFNRVEACALPDGVIL